MNSHRTLGSKANVLIISGLAIGTAFLWITLSQVHLSDVKRDLIDHALLGFAVPSVVSYALVFWFKAVRWQLLLSPVAAAPLRSLVPPILIGYVANLMLPAQLGEVVRTYLLGDRLKVDRAPILATIVAERMFDFMTLLLLLALALSNASQVEVPTLRAASYVVGGAAFGILALMIVGLKDLGMTLAAVRWCARVLPAWFVEYVVTRLESGVQGLQSIRSPWLLMRIALVSMAMWGAMAATVYLTLLALQIDVSMSAAVVVLALTVVGFTLPAIPGYIGTVQISFLLALRPYGVGPDSAVAASVFYHVLITVPPLIAALCVAILGSMSLTGWRTRH